MLFTFQMNLKDSDVSIPMTGIGLTQEDAATHLKRWSLKGTDWTKWELIPTGHVEMERHVAYNVSVIGDRDVMGAL